MVNILIISHYTEVPGVMDKVALYLKNHKYSLCFVLNPLLPKSSLKSIIKSDKKEITYKIFYLFQYIFEGVVSITKYKSTNIKLVDFDIAICFDPLSFLNTLIFKKLYKIKKIIYYNVDFSMGRFNNGIMNFIYLMADRFSYRKCDYFFYLTANQTKKIDPTNRFNEKAFLLKHTFNINSINKNIKKIPKSIIFSGTLGYSVSFIDLFEALKTIKRVGINFVFDIYGEGNQKKQLEYYVDSSIIKNNVHFKGIVSNEVLICEVLPKYSFGVCPYVTQVKNAVLSHIFTATDLTTKLVEYIAVGLPIISTRLTDFFNIIEANNFGFIVKNKNDWYGALIKLLNDDDLLNNYSENAFEYSKNYDEEKILTPIFDKILK